MGYSDLSAAFVYKNPLVRSTLNQLGFNDAFLKDAGWQTNCVGVFYQSAAPTGWTKSTATNDKLLRVVSGAGGGTGGTKAPSTSFSVAHTAHSISTQSDHTHDLAHTHDMAAGANTASSASGAVGADALDFLQFSTGGASTLTTVKNQLTNQSTVTSGAAGSHNHGGSTTGAALTDFTLAYCDVIFCTKDTSSGYTDETTAFAHNDKFNFDAFDILAANDDFLNARLMPSTSVMIWGQAAAPTGWTKLTSVDAKALRVVSGSGGATGGGSQDIGATIALNHTHSITSAGSHSHSIPNHVCVMNSNGSASTFQTPDASTAIQADGSGFLLGSSLSTPASRTCYKRVTASDGSGTTGTDSNHTHTVGSSLTDLNIAYVDLIQCSKDSAGAPYSYASLTGTISWKKLASKQRLNAFGKNDEYLKYHTPHSGEKTFFFMSAAPLTWTKITTQNDKALRMVSGSTGGTAGGTTGLSATIVLAHTHTISSYFHTHAFDSHTHNLASGAATANLIGSGPNLVPVPASSSNALITGESGVGVGQALKNATVATATFGSGGDTHSHGGATGSLLTSVALAYADVIYCSKD